MLRKSEPMLLVAPAMLVIILITIVPLFYSVYCSLFELKYMQFGQMVGLTNYIKVLSSPSFYRSMGITLIVTFSSALLSLLLGALLAIWIDRRNNFFGYSLQLVGLIPWVLSMTVAALLWKWVFDGEMGLMHYLFTRIGLQPVNFLANKTSAVLTLIFVITWRTIGYSMVMILAGLKGVPNELIEAAAVDGACRSKVFFHVRLPLIKTQALISTIVLTMSNFNNNTIPLTLTGGGPGNATDVITLVVYRTGFSNYRFGLASTQSTILFLINVIMIIIYIKAVKYDI